MSDNIPVRVVKYLYNLQQESDYKESFSLNELKDNPKTYVTLLGIDSDNLVQNQLEQYEASKVADHRIFSDLQDNTGTNVYNKLNGTDDGAKALQQHIAKALENTGEYEKQKDEYSNQLNSLKDYLKNIKPPFNPAVWLNTLRQDQGLADTALKEQQAQERKNIETLFKNPDFTESLEKTLGLKGNKELNVVKDNMLSALNKQHQEQQEKLNTNYQDNETQVLQAANKKFHEMAFRVIHKLYKSPANETTASIGAPNNKELDTTALAEKELITVSGRKITQDLETGKDSIEFKSKFLPSEWGNNKKSIRSLVMLQLAKGRDNITFDVDGFSDPKVAQKRARQCIEAAMESGIPIDKITVNINGQAQKPHEVMGPHLSRFTKIQQSVVQEVTPIENKQMKTALKDIRAAQTKSQPAPADAAAAPSSNKP